VVSSFYCLYSFIAFIVLFIHLFCIYFNFIVFILFQLYLNFTMILSCFCLAFLFLYCLLSHLSLPCLSKHFVNSVFKGAIRHDDDDDDCISMLDTRTHTGNVCRVLSGSMAVQFFATHLPQHWPAMFSYTEPWKHAHTHAHAHTRTRTHTHTHTHTQIHLR